MRIGKILKKWRLVMDYDLRTCAAMIGIAPATLMRIEQGKTTDSLTLMKLLNWITHQEDPAMKE